MLRSFLPYGLVFVLACLPARAPLLGKACETFDECGEGLVCSEGVCAAREPASWLAGPSLVSGLEFHGATRLLDGQVLLTGGEVNGVLVGQAALYDPQRNDVRSVKPLRVPRDWHGSVLLADGRVLVAAGNGSSGLLKSAELYDPVLDVWTATGDLKTGRAEFFLFLMPGGRVLAVGEPNGVATEWFDPQAGTWAALPGTEGHYSAASPVQLSDGSVLVSNDRITERFLPAQGSWVRVGTGGGAAQYNHAVVQLKNGLVLSTGGTKDSRVSLATTQLMDPTTGVFRTVAPMSHGREDHTLTVLPDGRVLVVGGMESTGEGVTQLDSVELFDPETEQWTPAKPLRFARTAHRATLLEDGSVLVTGGLSNGTSVVKAERYIP